MNSNKNILNRVYTLNRSSWAVTDGYLDQDLPTDNRKIMQIVNRGLNLGCPGPGTVTFRLT